MPTCPFLNRECFSECALYAPGIQGCSFVAQTMLLEDISKVAVLAYEKYLAPEAAKPVKDPAPPG